VCEAITLDLYEKKYDMPSFQHSLLLLLTTGAWRTSGETVTVTAPPSIPSQAPQFVSTDAFTSAILNSTNFFRTEHNASWIEWNSTIARFAGSYLDDVQSGQGDDNKDGVDDCKFAHSGGPYGENIAIGCSDATSCVDAWGNERKDYDFDHPDFSEATGHFTQLVWQNTTSVGCGRKLCGTQGWYLVCEYWPRGNVMGQFGEMVGRQTNGTGSTGSAVKPARLTLSAFILVLCSWLL